MKIHIAVLKHVRNKENRLFHQINANYISSSPDKDYNLSYLSPPIYIDTNKSHISLHKLYLRSKPRGKDV